MSNRSELQAKIDALVAQMEALPPDPLPTGTIEFSAYMHESDGRFTLADEIGDWSKITPEDRAKLDKAWDHLEAIFENERHRPFYEVELRCTLDLETGEVKILRVAGY